MDALDRDEIVEHEADRLARSLQDVARQILRLVARGGGVTDCARNDAHLAEQLVRGLDDLQRGTAFQLRLVEIGQPAIGALRASLLGPPALHPQPRMLAAEALALIGGSLAVDALIAALCAGDLASLSPVLRLSEESVRAAIARELGRLGDDRAVEPLSTHCVGSI